MGLWEKPGGGSLREWRDGTSGRIRYAVRGVSNIRQRREDAADWDWDWPWLLELRKCLPAVVVAERISQRSRSPTAVTFADANPSHQSWAHTALRLALSSTGVPSRVPSPSSSACLPCTCPKRTSSLRVHHIFRGNCHPYWPHDPILHPEHPIVPYRTDRCSPFIRLHSSPPTRQLLFIRRCPQHEHLRCPAYPAPPGLSPLAPRSTARLALLLSGPSAMEIRYGLQLGSRHLVPRGRR